MTVEEIVLEPMGPQHLRDALALSRQVGWPHRLADWELGFSISRGVVAVGDHDVLGTILMTPYGETGATINMVIVDGALRGRGLGRRLMEKALELAGGRAVFLVATAEGLPLYEKLGFSAKDTIVQYQGVVRPKAAPSTVAWAKDEELASCRQLDRDAFGHDRSALMDRLCTLARFAVIREGETVAAFAAIREFGRGFVIGPVVARTGEEAKDLIDYLLAQHEGDFVRVDTLASADLTAWLMERGLVEVGGGVEMHRGQWRSVGTEPKRHHTFALVTQGMG